MPHGFEYGDRVQYTKKSERYWYDQNPENNIATVVRPEHVNGFNRSDDETHFLYVNWDHRVFRRDNGGFMPQDFVKVDDISKVKPESNDAAAEAMADFMHEKAAELTSAIEAGTMAGYYSSLGFIVTLMQDLTKEFPQTLDES